MKIIINADDLGLSCLVNDEIFSLIANGRITSSTIMANAPATEDALASLLWRAHELYAIRSADQG